MLVNIILSLLPYFTLNKYKPLMQLFYLTNKEITLT